jgi:DNA-binding transcriptional MerR regulator
MDRNYSQITFDFAATERPLKPPPPESQLVVHVEEEKVPDDQVADDAVSEEPVVTFTPVAKPSGRGRKPQKSYAAEADLVSVPEDEVLFQKQYYSIGEVSQMFKVNASLLRFWESEFDIIKPRKNRKGDRHFRPVDIKNLQLIYDLLRRRKLTIDGARDFIKNNKKSQERFAMIQSLQKIKGFLLEVKATL